MIKSRQHFILIPLTILVAFGSGLLLFIVYIIIINNLTNLGDFDIIAMTLFLTSIAIFPLIMMFSLLRKFKIHSDKLEVIYAFGLIRHFYNYNELKVSDYTWRTSGGILIKTPDGEQMTLGQKQYSNYFEIREALQSKIKKEDIKLKYTTRLTRTILISFGILFMLAMIALKLK